MNQENFKVRWIEEEDQMLRESVKKHGTSNWSSIALELPNRNGKQCRERWVNQINPLINKSDWSYHEDLLLMNLSYVFGHKWSLISKNFIGRSVNSVKNRWRWINRHCIYHRALVNEINTNERNMRIQDPFFVTNLETYVYPFQIISGRSLKYTYLGEFQVNSQIT